MYNLCWLGNRAKVTRPIAACRLESLKTQRIHFEDNSVRRRKQVTIQLLSMVIIAGAVNPSPNLLLPWLLVVSPIGSDDNRSPFWMLLQQLSKLCSRFPVVSGLFWGFRRPRTLLRSCSLSLIRFCLVSVGFQGFHTSWHSERCEDCEVSEKMNIGFQVPCLNDTSVVLNVFNVKKPPIADVLQFTNLHWSGLAESKSAAGLSVM